MNAPLSAMTTAGASPQPGLRAPTMLQALPEPGRELVLAVAKRQVFKRGDLIVRQGEISRHLLIIESGRVSIRILTAAGDTVIMSVMGPGETFGEMALLLSHHERTATAQAVDDVTVRLLSREHFDDLRRHHPEANDFLMHILAERAERLSRRVVEAHHLQVDQRVARRLLEIGRLFAGERLPVVVPLTQSEIAQLAGTTRPTTNQILKGLEADGIIGVQRGGLEIWDVAGLRQRC